MTGENYYLLYADTFFHFLFSGLKHLRIYLDGQLRCDIIARKAPGEFLGTIDYGQFLSVVGTIERKPAPKEKSITGRLTTIISNNDLAAESDENGRTAYNEVCMVNQQYQTPVRLRPSTLNLEP